MADQIPDHILRNEHILTLEKLAKELPTDESRVELYRVEKGLMERGCHLGCSADSSGKLSIARLASACQKMTKDWNAYFDQQIAKYES